MLCAAEVGWWLSRSMFVATVIDLMTATSLANHASSSYSNPTHLSFSLPNTIYMHLCSGHARKLSVHQMDRVASHFHAFAVPSA